MDPGTALAVIGLALEAVKGLTAYFEAWHDCEEDVCEVRHVLSWYTQMFSSIHHVISQATQDISLLVRSIDESKDVCLELSSKLFKFRKEGDVESKMASLKKLWQRGFISISKEDYH